MQRRAAMVWLLVGSAAWAQRGSGFAEDTVMGGVIPRAERKLTRECNGQQTLHLDTDAVKAHYAKLKVETKLTSRYTLDHAIADAEKNCVAAAGMVGHLCVMNEGNHPGVASAAIKAVECKISEAMDAPPESDFKDGTWTVTFNIWSSSNELAGASEKVKISQEAALAKALGLDPPSNLSDDPMFHPPTELKRCTASSQCGTGKVCGRSDAVNHGPRCVDPGTANCSKGGLPYGHKDAKCKAGQLCSMHGYCFNQGEFPREGHNLALGARCYFAKECGTKNCVGQGSDQWSDRVGACARR
jgi:hypothetical protein